MGRLAAAALLLAAAAPVSGQTAPLDPAAMVRLADSDPGRSHKGVFTMRVRSASKEAGPTTYVNSEENYKTPGDVTFDLSPFAAKALAARLGGPAHSRLIGRTITVKGVLTRQPIVNTDGGRAGRRVSFNRWGYQVAVDSAGQILAVSEAAAN